MTHYATNCLLRHDKDRNLNVQACNQLSRAFKRIDTDNKADMDDYVTGNEADALATEIISLIGDWDCL